MALQKQKREMWMKIIVLLLTMVTSYTSSINGQVVKFIKNPINVKYRVYETQIESEANLIVYKVAKYDEAIRPGLWYIVENPALFKEAITLCKVLEKDDADLIVYYTADKRKAGYKNVVKK